MGRHAEGFRYEVRRGYGYARFTHNKVPYLISSGIKDSPEARSEAERIYARTVTGGSRLKGRVKPLVDLTAEWLESLAGILHPDTIKTYEGYVGNTWLKFFKNDLDEIADTSRVEAFAMARLKKVLRKTVHKELSAVRGFLRWCKQEKLLERVPDRPELPQKARGKRVGTQREKANDLSPEQVAAFLDALPYESERTQKGRRFPVQSRFAFAYETGFRPATLAKITWGDWDKGGDLTVRDEADKARFGRVVPLSATAEDVLRKLYAHLGEPADDRLIFGKHDYRVAITKACERAKIDLKLATYDLRHALGTHLSEEGAPLPATAFLLGHTQLTTTNKYAKGTYRAARAALDSRSNSVPKPVSESAKDGS